MSGRSRPTPDGGVPSQRRTVYSQSLERGLALLCCFTPDKHLLGIMDMADETGMSRSTAHRYANTLKTLGYLEQPPSGGRKYRLGSKVNDVGMPALNMLPLRFRGHVFLAELRRKVSYTVSAAVLQEDDVMIVDLLRGFRGHARLKMDIGPGSRLPAYCTSLGKVLLAHLMQNEQEAVLFDISMTQRGPNTITNRPALLRELSQVREVGFAVNDEEFVVGVRSIAMPVHLDDSVIGAVDIAVPISVATRKKLIDDFGPHLLEATELISAAIASSSENGSASD